MFGVRYFLQQTNKYKLQYNHIVVQLFCTNICVRRKCFKSHLFISSSKARGISCIFRNAQSSIPEGCVRYHTVPKSGKGYVPLDYALVIPAGVIPPVGGRQTRVVRRNKEDIEQIIEENFDKIDQFAKALCCSFEEMADLVKKDTRLVTSFSKEKVLHTIKCLKQYGYNESEILSNPPAFCLSIQTLESRLIEMKEVRCTRLYVLKYARKQFEEILKFYEKEKQVMKGFTSRETFLAALFGCEEENVVEKSVKFPQLSTYPVSRLNAAFQLLLRWGYHQNDIWNDLESLALPPKEIQYRLDRMNSVGLINKSKVFPLLHAIRKHQFEESVELWVQDEAALDGHPDLTTYLSSRLRCDVSEVEKMYRSCDALRRTRPRRLKVILDILLDSLQIPPYFILTRPVVLMYSSERLKFRLQILEGELISNPRTIIADLILPSNLFDKKYNLISVQDNLS